MKDEITITREEYNTAVSKAMDDLIEASKKKNNSAIATSLAGAFYSIFAAELLIVLFKDEDNLEIEEKN